MKRSKFTELQIAFALKQAELGRSVDEVCRKLGISVATFYNWKKKFCGPGPSELRRLLPGSFSGPPSPPPIGPPQAGHLGPPRAAS